MHHSYSQPAEAKLNGAKISGHGFNDYLMNGLILEKEKVVNPAHFYPNWAELAMLFSKQISTVAIR